MPKPSTFPTLYDEVLQINISKLKQWGYLAPGQFKSGALTWSSTDWGGTKEERGSILIRVNTDSGRPYIELDYKFRDEPRKYKVMLVSIPSNLGKGRVWYFLCPQTNKRCRKLYSICGYFLHREAFNGCLYESQTQTKKWRSMDRVYGSYFDLDRLYQQLYSKHFKRHYKGRPTRRYLKLMRKINEGERFPISEMKNLF